MVDYNEGISLALSAVAENLKKSNDLHEQTSSYFQKVLKKQVEEDEKEHMLTEEEEEKKSFNNMVEAISNSVITKVQKDLIAPLAKQLEDLAGDKAKKVSGTKWPMSSNDSPGDKEKTASMENKTEKGTQMAIEAMKKQESASPVLTVKATASAISSPVTWALLAVGGIYQYYSVSANKAVSASYCGDVMNGDSAREGCSVVRTINYNLEDISKYCSSIESIP